MYSAQQRVQFFQSESEFQSETSLNNSRYFDFTNQIISETDNIFLTLKKELPPNQNLMQEDKVKYLLSRAQILYKNTIPEHISYLNKIDAPQNAAAQVRVCSQKLQKLLKDYESLKNNTMIYKQFYNVYGKEFGYQGDASNFYRKERVIQIDDGQEQPLKPECIQINYTSRAKLKATPRVFMNASPVTNDKEMTNLRGQVHLLKKNIEDMKKKHDVELTNQRLLAEKRIRTYIDAQKQSNRGNLDSVSSELQNYSFKISCLEEEVKAAKQTLEDRDKTIEIQNAENISLRSEIQMLRKRDIDLEESGAHDKSYNTDMNDKEDRKIEKKLKLVQHENQILKSQLKTERQKIYRLTSDLSDEERKQLERVKRQLQRKSEEHEKLLLDYDKLRIELVQINHNYRNVSKIQEEIKDENEDLKKKVKLMVKEPNLNILNLSSAPEMENSMNISRKLQVSYYEGEGIEGLPYYDILNKEFKIRFRRACLRQKQLLHKANGLQIGVITTFQKPNKISLLLHLTNYSDILFTNIKGKLLNANQNKVNGETFELTELIQNDQVKLPVSLDINHYPLGPLILLLEYKAEKREELRVLLPSHIFKMMEFQELREPLKNPDTISIATERKIMKNLQDFRQFVKGGRISDGSIKLSAYHRHTHTQVHINLIQTREGVDLEYKHHEGNPHISQYFIKTLTFLLRK